MSPDKFRVLIVDDEPSIQYLVKRYLERNGFIVSCAGCGSEMRAILNIHPVQLVILDLGLPGESGFELLQEIRNEYSTSIIVLSSKESPCDSRYALENGADDCIVKPFDPDDLLTRSQTVLQQFIPIVDTNRYHYVFDQWSLNTRTHQLSDRKNRFVDLSPAEYQLLLVFITYPHVVLNREYLLQQTRGRPSSPFDRTIDVRVGKLRKKLDVTGRKTPLFETVRGAGYRFNGDVTAVQRQRPSQ